MAGLSGFVGGLQQGYTFVSDARSKQAAEDRMNRDAAYQEEARGRQRNDWKEADRIKAADKADIADVNAQYAGQAGVDASSAEQSAAAAVQQDKIDATAHEAVFNSDIPGAVPDLAPPATLKAPSLVSAGAPPSPQNAGAPSYADEAASSTGSPRMAPDVAAKLQTMRGAGGVPQPNNLNRTIEKQAELLRRKSDRGDLSAEDYAQKSEFLSRMRKEGVNDALAAFSTGDYEGGMAAFNRVGQHNGARILRAEEGTTLINGEKTPTHFVTTANPDGTRTVVDVAKARYQLLDMNTQLQHQDAAAKNRMQIDQHAATVQLGRDQLSQSAKDAAAGRAVQSQMLKLQTDQFNAGTPFGKIEAMGKARGRPLSSDEIENVLGISKIPRAVELQVQSLMKENDTDSAAIAKAVAGEGLNPTAMSTFGKNAAIRNEKLSNLLGPYSGQGQSRAPASDPFGFDAAKGGGNAAPAPVGGIRAALTAGARARLGEIPDGGAGMGAPALPPGAIDVRNDPVLTSLRHAMGNLDANDVKNTDTVMKLGAARNQRIDQLQQSNGLNAKLITD
ncbi:hypothetical protein AAKU55_003916 [Oxalobacteraceae bacterium GrIS 1.11]